MNPLRNIDQAIVKEENAVAFLTKVANGETHVDQFLVNAAARKLTESKARLQRIRERRDLIKAIFGPY